MCTRRLTMFVVLVGLAVSMSAAVAKADGDPAGKFQAPGSGGTPGVDNEFGLAPFGQTSPGCTYDGTTEDCVLKNQSNTNWTWASVTAGSAIPCADISFTTDLFSNPVSCLNDPITGDPTITVSGVNYSPQTNALFSSVAIGLGACNPNTTACTPTNVQTLDVESPLFSGNCQPSGGYFPGVLIGCDFEFLLGPGPDDSGTWPLNTPFSVVAPEPSSLGMLMIGLGGLPFAIRRRKSLI